MGTGLKELIEYGYRKNFAEGKIEGKAEIISKLMEIKGFSFDSACKYLDISGEMKDRISTVLSA